MYIRTEGAVNPVLRAKPQRLDGKRSWSHPAVTGKEAQKLAIRQNQAN